MFQNLKGSKCSYSSNSKHDVGNPAKADYLINVEVVLEITEWCTVYTCRGRGRLKYGELKHYPFRRKQN